MSMQNSAGAGKAAKFVAANPLAPMADPFSGMGDDEKEYQKELSDNLEKRMAQSLIDLKQRHANGTAEKDDPDRAPTGSAYKAHALMQREKRTEEARRQQEVQRMMAMKQEAESIFSADNKNQGFGEVKANGDVDGDGNEDDDSSNGGAGSDDDLDQYDDLLDDDLELDAIRQRRIDEMRAQQVKTAEHKSLGHGELRTILQDEFLTECTGGSKWVAVHFFHKEFERCKIMDHHLKAIAPMHLSCKFLRLDAEKTPFFVSKLCIRTLPTLLVFEDGKAIDRLTGFEGLAIDPAEPDKWHTGKLQQWLATTGAIKYKIPTEELKEEMRRMGIRPKGTVWSGTSRSGFSSTVYDSDDE